MILELLLIFSHVGIFYIFYKFRRIIKAMTDFLELFDEVDTPKEAVLAAQHEQQHEQQHGNRQLLIEVVSQGKAGKLPGKTPWTVNRINKAPDSVVDKLANEYNQNVIREKAENTGRAVSGHLVNFYSQNISRVLKIDDIDALRQDIDHDPIIKDSMANIGYLMVNLFGSYLAPVLIAAHTANHAQGFTPANAEPAHTTDEVQEG